MVLSLIINNSYAQEETSTQIPGYDHVLPASPEVSALFNFIKTPVGYYTGIPDISIPIYTVKEGNIEMPIVLRYHAGGVKVGDVSSWVGVGWTLEAGGAIGREVVGMEDDKIQRGFYYKGNTIPPTIDLYDQNDANYLESVVIGEIDTKPDFFSYSMPAGSGKFVFGNNKSILLIPQKKIKITVQLGSSYKFDKWVITNEAGMKFYFGGTGYIETSECTTSCNTGNSDDAGNEPYISAWLLKGIASADSQDSVSISYKNYTQIQSVSVNETDYIEETGITCQTRVDDVTCTATNWVDGILPEYIRTKNTDIRFYSSHNRPDLESGSEGLRLDSIEITDKKTLKKTRYCFTYDNQTDKRIWLTFLKIKDGNGNQQNQYSFAYNHSIHLPPRDSKKIDHWGYYNGQSNSTLLPPIYIGTEYLEGADRDVYSNYNQAGMLTRITYPTKGYTDFTYESNNVYDKHTILNEAVCQAHIGSASASGDRVAIDSFLIYDDDDYPDHPGTSLSRVGISASISNNYDTELNAGVSLYDKSGRIYYRLSSNKNEADKISILLRTPGWYYVEATGFLRYDNASIRVTHYVPSGVSNNRLTGGLRIKEINHIPLIGPTIKTTYEYVDFKYPDHSSGTGGRIPRYEGSYSFTSIIRDDYQETGNGKIEVECNIRYRSSNPQSAFNITQGAYVGYRNVRIIESQNNENGRTENIYTSFNDYPDRYRLGGIIPVVSNDYKRGMLLESKVFNASGTLVSKMNNSYSFLGNMDMSFDNSYNKASTGLSVVKTKNSIYEAGIGTCSSHDVLYHYIPCVVLSLKDRDYSSYLGEEIEVNGFKYAYIQDPCDGKPVGAIVNMLNCYDKYKYWYYDINSEFIYQTNTISTHYFLNGDSLKTSKSFYYDNWDHYQISRISEPKNGKTYTTQYLYPEDFKDNTGFVGLLKKCHIHNKPIENVTYFTDESGGNLKIISGSVNKYSNSVKDQLDTVFTLQPLLNKPIALSDFKFSNRGKGVLPSIYDPIKYNYQRDKNYKPELISDKYITGKIIEYHKLNDIHTVILWGYNSTLPIAKFENVTYSAVTANATLLNYINQLQNYTDLKSASDRNNLRTLNTNIRNNAPSNSIITTYTYIPLYGITSQTDINGKTTYYEYDNSGRLKYIRDQDYKVIQEYNYHFKE